MRQMAQSGSAAKHKATELCQESKENWHSLNKHEEADEGSVAPRVKLENSLPL
jgi:hypothetical protein